MNKTAERIAKLERALLDRTLGESGKEETKGLFGKVSSAGAAITSIVAAVTGVLAVGLSIWTSNNSFAESEKERPWEDRSFTTHMVTKGGGVLTKFYDDGAKDNGNDYIHGIYSLWKVSKKGRPIWESIITNKAEIAKLDPMWQIEFNHDKDTQAATQGSENKIAEEKRIKEEIAARQADADAAKAIQQSNLQVVTGMLKSGGAQMLATEGRKYQGYSPESLTNYFGSLGVLVPDVEGQKPSKDKLTAAFEEVAKANPNGRLGKKELDAVLKRPAVMEVIDDGQETEFKRRIEDLKMVI